MASPAQGALRWARSAALTVATVGLAAAAHVLAGGHLPGWGVMAVLVTVTSLVGALVTGRQRGVAVIVATMAGLQVGLHEGFVLLTPMSMGSGSVTGACPGAPASHLLLHGGPQLLCHALPAAGHPAHGSAWMLLAHGVAVLVLSVVLAGRERALWVLHGLVLPRFPRRPTVLANVPAHSWATTASMPSPTSASRSSLVRRGPPVSSLVATG
jgi:hypothetical protein